MSKGKINKEPLEDHAASDSDKIKSNSKRSSSSKNEKHGDGGRRKKSDALKVQIAKLEVELVTATVKRSKQIKTLIRHLKQDAANKAKGEEHSRDHKRS